MVFRKISREFKERAIWLSDKGYFDEDIAEILGVSVRSIDRWKENIEEYGDVAPSRDGPRGRPQALGSTEKDRLFELLEDSPSMYLDEIQDWIAVTFEIGLSKSSIHRLIKDAGLTYKMLHKAAIERDEEARIEFRNLVQENLTAEMIVAVDETSKDDRTIFRRWGRAKRGEQANIGANFVRGERFSLVAALSVEGYVGARVVSGSVDGEEFFDFIVNDVLPKMNRYPGKQSVLLLDNCAIHKMDALEEVVTAHGCWLLFLPPYSPDMNPIEESFSAVKSWLRRNYAKLVDSEYPEIDLLEACSIVTRDKALKWFENAGYAIQ